MVRILHTGAANVDVPSWVAAHRANISILREILEKSSCQFEESVCIIYTGAVQACPFRNRLGSEEVLPRCNRIVVNHDTQTNVAMTAIPTWAEQ